MTSYIPPEAAPVSELRAWFSLAIMNLRLHLIYDGLKLTVGHDDCVILSTKVCLYALAGRTTPRILALRILFGARQIKRSPLIDVFTSPIAANKTNSFDGWVVANGIHDGHSTVHHVQDTWRDTSLLT